METKHTPGTWVINEFAEIEANNSILGKVYCCDTFPGIDEETNANGKLIAAAPDLLEACQWAIQQFKKLSDDGKYPEHMLANNGGEGMMPLVRAIKRATE